MKKSERKSSGDLKRVSSTRTQSAKSTENALNIPEDLPLGPQNEKEVIDWYFYQLLPFIIDATVIYDPLKEEVESQCDEDTLNSEVFDFLGSTGDSLRELHLKRHPKRSKPPRNKSSSSLNLNKSKSGSLKRSKSDKKSNVTIISSKASSRSSSEHTICSIPSIFDENQEVKVFFKSGCVYIGHVRNKIMNGLGKFLWPDGTIYEGEFKDGFPTGFGEMILPNLDRYEGEFFHGFFHGEGTLSVKATQMFYKGSWKGGKKHGKGWLMYEANNYYNGEWCEDFRHGKGIRYYKSKAKYKGGWKDGLRDGLGTMIWENNDYFKGDWTNGLINGYGEYVWQAIFNTTLAFPILSCYMGEWVDGRRHGTGTMYFGTDCGARYVGEWKCDFKDGDGVVICGNGKLVQKEPLFIEDKPVMWIDNPLPDRDSINKSLYDIPVFTTAEDVDVGYYIDKILTKVGNYRKEALEVVREFEQLCIRNVIVEYLPKLTKLYHDYARIATKDASLNFEPALVRLFLWVFYRDIEVTKMGITLVETDEVLKEHPGCCLETLHDPYEKIYFWQFLISLIGVALHLRCLEDVVDFSLPEGACSIILKRFLSETVFKPAGVATNSTMQGVSHVLRYIDLVPLTSVYGLYRKIGESHTARDFLKATCMRKQQLSTICDFDNADKSYKVMHGKNSVPFLEQVVFIQESEKVIEEDPKLKRLVDFRCLGPKNVTKCICKVCPTVQIDGVIANMDYPLVFLEFYEILLNCIFLYLELKMKRERKKILEELEMARTLIHGAKSVQSKMRLGRSSRTSSGVRASRTTSILRAAGKTHSEIRTSRSATIRGEKTKKHSFV